MTAPKLEALRFYDGGLSGALALRVDFGTPLGDPEWVSGGVNVPPSPVAYPLTAASGEIYVLAKFSAPSSFTGAYWIKADGGGVLGAIPAIKVEFVSGVADPEYVKLVLSNQTLSAGGVSKQDVIWNWSYAEDVKSAPWKPLDQSIHRVYVTLAVPTAPWQQFGGSTNTQLPWTKVLDYACQWATGATTAQTAAAAVTQAVNSQINLAYDTTSGASVYTEINSFIISEFLLSQFLDFLIRNVGKGNIVNCVDCATIVSTFANSLGCNLSQARMYGVKGGINGSFDCNKIIAIGYTQWAYPFPPGNCFAFHEVAWSPPTDNAAPIYDACLQLDSGNDPWDWTTPTVTHTAALPTNMIFTSQPVPTTVPLATPFTTQTYRERLAQNTGDGIAICAPTGPRANTNDGRRAVV